MFLPVVQIIKNFFKLALWSLTLILLFRYE